MGIATGNPEVLRDVIIRENKAQNRIQTVLVRTIALTVSASIINLGKPRVFMS